MPDDDAAPYDFSDWEIGAGEEVLLNVVRDNLRALQTQIRAGHWVLHEWTENLDPLPPDQCSLQWKWGPNWIEDAPLLALRPAQLAEELIENIGHIAKSGMVSLPGDKDELRDYWQRVTAGWRAALDAVDEEAKRLLDLPNAADG